MTDVVARESRRRVSSELRRRRGAIRFSRTHADCAPTRSGPPPHPHLLPATLFPVSFMRCFGLAVQRSNYLVFGGSSTLPKGESPRSASLWKRSALFLIDSAGNLRPRGAIAGTGAVPKRAHELRPLRSRSVLGSEAQPRAIFARRFAGEFLKGAVELRKRLEARVVGHRADLRLRVA